MPEKTNENKELKEKKEVQKKKSTKKSSKVSETADNNVTKKVPTSKKTTKKTVSDKTATNKSTTTSSKKGNSSKKASSMKSTTTSKTSNQKKSNTKNPEDIKNITTKTKNVVEKENKSLAKNKTNTEEKKESKTTARKEENKTTINKKEETKVEKKKEEKVKEETVIQKIKNFIAKIIAMQEEARKEDETKKAEKYNREKETKVEKNKTTKTQENTTYMLEYYDLPYRYNETVVKILAQTPKRLFVYWDISDKDRQKYLKAFGERFFEETYPVLLVHNEEKDYTFEVAINDFANSWYLDINDPKSKYVIELGRKFRTRPGKVNIAKSEETKDVVLYNDYVPIITSNVLEVPNNRILFENVQRKVLYRNVKNNEETFVDIENNQFTKNMEHIYNVYDLYKEFYKDEIKDENMLDLLNPSSMSSSTFK